MVDTKTSSRCGGRSVVDARVVVIKQIYLNAQAPAAHRHEAIQQRMRERSQNPETPKKTLTRHSFGAVCPSPQRETEWRWKRDGIAVEGIWELLVGQGG